jgi:hypothetical protein
MPSDINYLSFDSPALKPVSAPVWGYFYMLIRDNRYWIDNHRVGLGPDPTTYWKQQFARHPPDAILLRGMREFAEVVRTIRLQQYVDIYWMEPVLQSDYQCVAKGPLRMFARNGLVNRLTSEHWHVCTPDPRWDSPYYWNASTQSAVIPNDR